MSRILPTPGVHVYDTGSRCFGVVTRIHDDRIEMKFDAPGYQPAYSGMTHDTLWRSPRDLVVIPLC